MKDGVIADFDMTEQMLSYFIKKLNVKGFMSKPNILICAPTNTTDIERKAIRQAAEKSGGGNVYLEEEPKVAAIGAGLDIFEPCGNMVIDIGGGTSDIAVLSLGDEHTAETIKIEIGSSVVGNRQKETQVRGRDVVTGLPKTITLTSDETAEAMNDTIDSMIASAHDVLSETPPELASDIIDRGIVITGGGALLDGISQRFSEVLTVPVMVAETPLDDVAVGSGKLLEHIEELSKEK